MDTLAAPFGTLMQDNAGLFMSAFVFLMVMTLTLSAATLVRSRYDVRRRAAGIADDGPPAESAVIMAGGDAARRMLAYVDKVFAQSDERRSKVLRQQLTQAGFLGKQAVAWYFIARFALAFAGMGLAAIGLSLWMPTLTGTSWWLALVVGGGFGYIMPGMYLGRRAKKRQLQHRMGFPDFMDLMVVCAEAGLSMESAVDKVGRELLESYPSLSLNLYMTSLEMRAGKRLGEALEHLADRLGIEEARTLATLLQQSEELGSSLTNSLRVYSDEMRHKRLSRAEEKAHALPVKLVIPLGLFIFPVLLIVLMLPVVIRMSAMPS
jgi:tight adherence protein C